MKINQSQQFIGLVAVGLLIFAALFPPWVDISRDNGKLSRKFSQGNYTILNPPSRAYTIDYQMLLVEWFIITLSAVGGMMIYSKSKHQTMDRLRSRLHIGSVSTDPTRGQGHTQSVASPPSTQDEAQHDQKGSQ